MYAHSCKLWGSNGSYYHFVILHSKMAQPIVGASCLQKLESFEQNQNRMLKTLVADNRLSYLSDHTRDILKELGNRIIGDVRAILKHAEKSKIRTRPLVELQLPGEKYQPLICLTAEDMNAKSSGSSNLIGMFIKQAVADRLGRLNGTGE